MNEAQVRAIALFFLFSLMDEKVAMQAAQKAVVHFKASGSSNPDARLEKIDDVKLIRVLSKLHRQYRKQLTRTRQIAAQASSLTLPENLQIGSWAKFQKDGGEPEVLSVLFAKIFKLSDQAIAEGMSVSLGTARYRIGKGLRQIGLHLQKDQSQKPRSTDRSART